MIEDSAAHITPVSASLLAGNAGDTRDGERARVAVPAPSKISAMVLSKGDSDYIRFCLASIHDIVDEIIVYGDYEVPEQLFPKVKHIHQEEDDVDFASFRNHALQHITGDWVLVLDADEVLSKLDGNPVARDDLDKKIKEGFDAFNIFTIHFIYNYFTIDGRNNGMHFTSARLFRKDAFAGYTRRIHEHLIPIDDNFMVTNTTDFAIFHFGHCKGMEALRRKYQMSMKFGKENPFSPEYEGKTLQQFLKGHDLFRGTRPLIHYGGHLPQVLELW